jgi:hypothetical protein
MSATLAKLRLKPTSPEEGGARASKHGQLKLRLKPTSAEEGGARASKHGQLSRGRRGGELNAERKPGVERMHATLHACLFEIASPQM